MTTALSLRKRTSYISILIAILVLLFYNGHILLRHGIPLSLDAILNYYPSAYALHASLQSGTLPYWTPQLQCGFPIFAEGQFSATYLPNLAAMLILDPDVAYGYLIVFHGFLALGFGFLWGRTLHLSITASTWLGLTLALTVPGRSSSIPMLASYVWTPMLFTVTERYVQRKAIWEIWPVALCVGMQWTTGFPQLAFYAAIAATLYLIVRVLGEDCSWSQRCVLLAAWLLGAFCGGLLAAPQLLSTYELAGYSIRSGGIEASMSGQNSLFPPALVTLILPGWQSFFAGSGLGSGGYIGLVPIYLTSLTLHFRPLRRKVFPLLTVAGVFAVLALGRYQPFFFIVRRLPGFSSFRAPDRCIFITHFALITLMGYGWDKLFSWSASHDLRKWLRKILLGGLTIQILNITVGNWLLQLLRPRLLELAELVTRRFVFSDHYHLQSWNYYQAKIQDLYQLVIKSTSWHERQNLIPILVTVTILVLTELHEKYQTRRWWSCAWSALLIIELLAIAGWVRNVQPTTPIVEEPQSATIVKSRTPDELYRTFWVTDEKSIIEGSYNIKLLAANYNLILGIPSTGVYSPLGFHSYYRLLEDLGSINLGFGLPPTTAERISKGRPLLSFLNVRYIFSSIPLEHFELIAFVDSVYIYHNDQALPRAFLVDEVRVAATHEQSMDWTRSNAAFLGKIAIVETSTTLPITPGAAAASSVQITYYDKRDIALEVSAAGNTLLVLTDSYYPGWSAQIDGETTEIYQASGAFRALYVTKGEHQITFHYTPSTLKLGRLMLMIGASLVFSILLISIRSHFTLSERNPESFEPEATHSDR